MTLYTHVLVSNLCAVILSFIVHFIFSNALHFIFSKSCLHLVLIKLKCLNKLLIVEKKFLKVYLLTLLW